MIIIDDREHTQHKNTQRLLAPIPTKVERLEAADFAFLNHATEPVGIERCHVTNFLQKLRDGEMESQLRRCQQDYSQVILLLEGIYDEVSGLLALYNVTKSGHFRYKVFANTQWAYIQGCKVRLSSMGIEIIEAHSFEASMDTVRMIYNQRTKPNTEQQMFRHTRRMALPTKLTNNPSVGRLMGLIPRLPEKTAILIMQKFGSLWNVLLASDQELMGVNGVSKTTVKKLREVLTYVHNNQEPTV